MPEEKLIQKLQILQNKLRYYKYEQSIAPNKEEANKLQQSIEECQREIEKIETKRVASNNRPIKLYWVELLLLISIILSILLILAIAK